MNLGSYQGLSSNRNPDLDLFVYMRQKQSENDDDTFICLLLHSLDLVLGVPTTSQILIRTLEKKVIIVGNPVRGCVRFKWD